MNSTEIIEGNKLIAKFISNKISIEFGYLIDNEWFEPRQFKFNSSWNWLMPVVNKIEHLYEDEHSLPRFEINSHHCKFSVNHPRKYKSWIVGCYKTSPEKVKANTKIEAAWMVAVEFIKYHNKQKQQ